MNPVFCQHGWHFSEYYTILQKGWGFGQFHTSVKVIFNKYDLNEEMASAFENKLYAKWIEITGKIPFDESMVYALLEGKTINEFEPQSLVTNELKKMWNKIISIIYEP